MFFVSKVYKNKVAVMDSKDGVEEFYDKSYIRSIADKFRIIGVGKDSYTVDARLVYKVSNGKRVVKKSDIKYPKTLVNVIFSNTVEMIDFCCFVECDNLVCLHLPHSLSCVEDEAFMGIHGLRYIIADSDDLLLNGRCFRNCDNLETVIFNNKHMKLTIQDSSFYGCRSLKTVKFPNDVRCIENYAFAETGITAVKDLCVDDLGVSAFQSCTQLEGVSITTDTIPSFCFHGCTSLKSVDWKSNPYSPDLSSINGYAFFKTALTEFRLPENIDMIGCNAFEGCKDLRYVNFEDAKSSRLYISDCAFKDCVSLEKVSLGKSCMVFLKEGCFSGCTGLKEVELYGRIDLDCSAFEGCTGVERLVCDDVDVLKRLIPLLPSLHEVVYMGYSFIIPSLEERDSAYLYQDKSSYGCYIISTIDGKIEHTSPDEMLGLKNCHYDINDDSILDATVLDDFFHRYTKIMQDNNVLPRGIDLECEYRGARVTYNTQGVARPFDGTFMIMPKFISELTDDFKLDDCPNLKRVSLGDVSEIPSSLFENCDKLEVIDAYSLSGVPDRCFSGCSSLKVAQGVLSDLDSMYREYNIGNYAFSDCSSLESIVFDNRSEVSIGSCAFKGCTSLRTLDMKGVHDLKVGKDAFKDCPNLHEIYVETKKIASDLLSAIPDAFTSNLNIVIISESNKVISARQLVREKLAGNY